MLISNILENGERSMVKMGGAVNRRDWDGVTDLDASFLAAMSSSHFQG
jgi:hypothetical protein